MKRLPSLARDIAAFVDKTIMDSINDGVQFPPSERLLSAWDFLISIADDSMTHEKDMAGFSDKTTALFCALIAVI